MPFEALGPLEEGFVAGAALFEEGAPIRSGKVERFAHQRQEFVIARG